MPVELDPGMRAAREMVVENSSWIRPLQQEIGRVIVGQTASARSAADRAPYQRPRAARRRARAGQNARAEDLGQLRRRTLQAASIHPRHAAGRHRRHDDLQSAGRRVSDQARADFQQSHSRRRDQSRTGQGAKRAAGSDAGAAGDDRRRNLRAAQSIPRAGHAEPAGTGRDIPASRSADRSIHDEGHRQLPEPHRGARHFGCDGDHRTDDRSAPHGERRADPRRTARGQHALRGRQDSRLHRGPGARDAPAHRRLLEPERLHPERRFAARDHHPDAGGARHGVLEGPALRHSAGRQDRSRSMCCVIACP